MKPVSIQFHNPISQQVQHFFFFEEHLVYLSSLITFCPELRYIIGLTDFFGMHTKSLNKSNFPIQCTYQVIQKV